MLVRNLMIFVTYAKLCLDILSCGEQIYTFYMIMLHFILTSDILLVIIYNLKIASENLYTLSNEVQMSLNRPLSV